MTEPQRAIDLVAVATSLRSVGKFPRLAASIRRASLVQSCLADVKQAIDAIEALDALLASRRGEGTDRRIATEASLLTAALLLYARATSTGGGSDERGAFDILPRLNESEITDHRQLLDLRNRAVAHVLPNGAIASLVWHNETVMLVDTGNGWVAGAATKRVQTDKTTTNCLRRQLKRAETILKAAARERFNALTKEVGEAFSHPEVVDIMGASFFDLETFLGSREAVAQAIGGIKKGEARGIVVRQAATQTPGPESAPSLPASARR